MVSCLWLTIKSCCGHWPLNSLNSLNISQQTSSLPFSRSVDKLQRSGKSPIQTEWRPDLISPHQESGQACSPECLLSDRKLWSNHSKQQKAILISRLCQSLENRWGVIYQTFVRRCLRIIVWQHLKCSLSVRRCCRLDLCTRQRTRRVIVWEFQKSCFFLSSRKEISTKRASWVGFRYGAVPVMQESMRILIACRSGKGQAMWPMMARVFLLEIQVVQLCLVTWTWRLPHNYKVYMIVHEV